MSQLNRDSLKSGFTAGSQATSSKFSDAFDSVFIKTDDSVLLGPSGQTGNYGLMGPIGGTYIGFYLLGSTAPTGPTASGSTGQVITSVVGTTGYVYLHNGTRWFKIESSPF
jgi:hypothetical protein